jgi:hypothetical protein
MPRWYPLSSGNNLSRSPMVQWWKRRADTGSTEPIDNSYPLWSKFKNNASITPPEGWKRDFHSGIFDGQAYYSTYIPGTECTVVAISRAIHEQRSGFNEFVEQNTQPELKGKTSYEFVQVLWVS